MALNLNSFTKHLLNLGPCPEQHKFLLAVSGGADSMVLASLSKAAGLNFEVAHVNYRLRGEDSDLDQQLVQDFCIQNNVKCHFYEVSETDHKPENSVQLWARRLRYGFFFRILKQERLDFIMTAHHLNDDLETFFINLSRGSGIKGLAGIPRSDNRILRPLLGFSKKEIYGFAKENHVSFREDASNAKSDYLRNKIRNRIIPEIEREIPNFLTGFAESLMHLSEANAFIRAEVGRALSEISSGENSAEFSINKEKLHALPAFLQTEIIRTLGFRGLEIQKLRQAETGKMFRSASHEIRITRREIVCRLRT